ncbi:MAG: ferric reductase-like transmembrane domain-containing protein [Candidatus Anstonellales archaeon]
MLNIDKPTKQAIIISIAVILAFFIFYSGYSKEKKALDFSLLYKIISFEDYTFSIKEINKLSALAGLTLLAMAFLPGPLSKLWPQIFSKYLVLRKPIGIIGFLLILLHSYLSFVYYYKSDFYGALFNNPKVSAFIAALIAFIIFTAMALTSTKEAVNKMGYEKWKLLQRTGYIALALSLIHFIIIETKPDIGFDVRPFAYIALIIALLTLLLRIYVHIRKAPERKSYEEHFRA